MRPAFLAALARPLVRRYSIALSMSALVSTSAFLQSLMPAPVRSRRSLIIAAEISAIVILLQSRCPWVPTPCGRHPRSRVLVVGRGRGLGGEVHAALGDLDHRAVAAGADVDDLLLDVVLLVAGPAGGALLVQARADDAGVGDAGREQADGADGVIVARDDEVDVVRVAVGVGDRDHRQPELAGLG